MNPEGVLVNDVHSQLNPTRVIEIIFPDSLDRLRHSLDAVRQQGRSLSIAGGRHSMGGQQFATDAILFDMTRLQRVLCFDREAGTVEVEAGLQWPGLIDFLNTGQQGRPDSWTIRQKQTGANRLTIGGAVSANVHGRGLQMAPIGADVEALTILGADGELRTCSRSENTELFRSALGGYGLFGLIYSVTLRLVPRRKVQRVVEVMDLHDLMPAFESRITDGFLYGDFQFNIAPGTGDFLSRGVFSCYRPVGSDTPFPEHARHLAEADWQRLVYLAHVDKAQAFQIYTDHYLSTTGQIYWSDTHQLAVYLDDYHRALDRKLGAASPATEVITELFVPRGRLADFMEAVREDFHAHDVNLIYGTVRLVEPDHDAFLAWAKRPYACVIFNLHVEHTPAGLEASARAFRRLIDRAAERDGSFYLTYHRHATRSQVEACYPQFSEFLRLKERHDPEGRFQSDWYRHYRALFAPA